MCNTAHKCRAALVGSRKTVGLCHGLDDEGGTVVHVVGFHWRAEFHMILSRDKLGINDKKKQQQWAEEFGRTNVGVGHK